MIINFCGFIEMLAETCLWLGEKSQVAIYFNFPQASQIYIINGFFLWQKKSTFN